MSSRLNGWDEMNIDLKKDTPDPEVGEQPYEWVAYPGELNVAKEWGSDPSKPQVCRVSGSPGSFLAKSMKAGFVDATLCDNIGPFAGWGMEGGQLNLDAEKIGRGVGGFLSGDAIVEISSSARIDYVGFYMKSGTIIIHGNVGDWAGYKATGGEIIVTGEIGSNHNPKVVRKIDDKLR